MAYWRRLQRRADHIAAFPAIAHYANEHNAGDDALARAMMRYIMAAPGWKVTGDWEYTERDRQLLQILLAIAEEHQGEDHAA
jgi:hypothetical protein